MRSSSPAAEQKLLRPPRRRRRQAGPAGAAGPAPLVVRAGAGGCSKRLPARAAARRRPAPPPRPPPLPCRATRPATTAHARPLAAATPLRRCRPRLPPLPPPGMAPRPPPGAAPPPPPAAAWRPRRLAGAGPPPAARCVRPRCLRTGRTTSRRRHSSRHPRGGTLPTPAASRPRLRVIKCICPPSRSLGRTRMRTWRARCWSSAAHLQSRRCRRQGPGGARLQRRHGAHACARATCLVTPGARSIVALPHVRLRLPSPLLQAPVQLPRLAGPECFSGGQGNDRVAGGVHECAQERRGGLEHESLTAPAHCEVLSQFLGILHSSLRTPRSGTHEKKDHGPAHRSARCSLGMRAAAVCVPIPAAPTRSLLLALHCSARQDGAPRRESGESRARQASCSCGSRQGAKSPSPLSKSSLEPGRARAT